MKKIVLLIALVWCKNGMGAAAAAEPTFAQKARESALFGNVVSFDEDWPQDKKNAFLEGLEKLINEGVRINRQCGLRRTMLEHMIEMHKPTMIKLLYNNGATLPNTAGTNFPLLWKPIFDYNAWGMKHSYDTVKALMEIGGSPLERNDQGQTVIEMLDALIKTASPEKRNELARIQKLFTAYTSARIPAEAAAVGGRLAGAPESAEPVMVPPQPPLRSLIAEYVGPTEEPAASAAAAAVGSAGPCGD